MYSPRTTFAHDIFMEEAKEKKLLTENDIQFIAHHIYLDIAKAQINGTYSDDIPEKSCKLYEPFLNEQSLDKVIGCVMETGSWLSNPFQNPQYLSIKSKIEQEKSLSSYEQDYLSHVILFFALTEENPDIDSKFKQLTQGVDIFAQNLIYKNIQSIYKWIFA